MPPRRRLPVSRAALAVIMLPVEILREILSYLDTKLLTHDIYSVHGPNSQIPFMQWTGTQRMQNRARLRRSLGQTGWVATQELYGNLDIVTPGPFNY